MPSEFLTLAERERYQTMPVFITEQDRQRYFYLTAEDGQLLGRFRHNYNRLGVALTLCLIRYLGYLPDGWQEHTPASILSFLISQLQAPSAFEAARAQDASAHPLPEPHVSDSTDGYLTDGYLLHLYGKREATRSQHLHQILYYLRWRKWQPMDAAWLENWLLERALEHDNDRLLLELACQKLRHEKILRPAIGTLERLVGSMSDLAHQQSYRLLQPLLTEPVCQQLDDLLLTDPILKITRHRWLCRPASVNTPATIRQTLLKLEHLQKAGVPGWDLGSLHINRQKRLTQIARNRTNKYIQRLSPQKRYPMLVAFLKQSLIDITDAVLKMVDDYWEDQFGRSRRELELYQQTVAKNKDELIRLMTRALGMVVDEEHIPPESLRENIYQTFSKQQLLVALQTSESLLEPTRYSYLHFLQNRYSAIKHFSPQLLSDIEFTHAFEKDDFPQALALVNELQNGSRRKLPSDAPSNFITPLWGKFIGGLESKNQKAAYELCVLSTLRDRLRSGDVFVHTSRKYADWETYLIARQQWPSLRAEVCRQLLMPDPPEKRIHERVSELEELLRPVDQLLADGGEIRVEDGQLVLPRLKAEELPDSVEKLSLEISKRMPQVDLSEIIVEVDAWLNFSGQLVGLENMPRSEQHIHLLYASLLCNGCNIPLSDMAQSGGLDYHSLWWTASNYLREETLRAANTCLVNFQHGQWLASYTGDGTLSSSDGQRFPVSGKIRNAKSIVRYYGYGAGVTFYTHTSDQYSQYGSKVIASTERDATHVLDEILGNETELEIMEHTTDTSGYTDIIFALFDLLGMQFSPRLRDIRDQKLCRVKNASHSYPDLRFSGTVDPNYILQHWEELLRVAGSMKLGYVTASLFISKLQSYPRQNNLTYVLQQYGKLIKTIFILRYLLSQPMRRRINTQLNKGEQLHALRSWLWFGGDGILRRKQEEDQQEVVSSLNLLTNIVVVWNTVYMQQILKQLQKEGYPVNEDDFEHLSPARFAHINRLGKYSFPNAQEFQADKLRPLRNPI